jgi:hypothetical protein
VVPSVSQLLEEAASILASGVHDDMYASVLATSIAGQLNTRAQLAAFDAPSPERLVEALGLDARFTVTYSPEGFALVGANRKALAGDSGAI